MKFENRLQPFTVSELLRMHIVSASQVDFNTGDDVHFHFGFGPTSKQARFFSHSSCRRRIVAMLWSATLSSTGSTSRTPPTSMLDDRVVCRLFGEMDRDGSLELWHLSTRASHPLNDSQQGRRWGVHNLETMMVAQRVRWCSLHGGTRITCTNAKAHVRGSPNPYAVELIVRCAEYLRCPSVRQHDDMPCATLFHPDYDQRTHPATMLIYEALGFKRPKGMHHYFWHRSFMPSLIHSYAQCIQKMHLGLSVV